jgi:hypothetical protein
MLIDAVIDDPVIYRAQVSLLPSKVDALPKDRLPIKKRGSLSRSEHRHLRAMVHGVASREFTPKA